MKKWINIKHLNVHKSRPRSPQSCHREVPVHRTTQHMNGSNINAMRIHVHVGTQTSELTVMFLFLNLKQCRRVKVTGTATARLVCILSNSTRKLLWLEITKMPGISSGSLNRAPASAGGKGGNVTSAGWQVTLCDPVCHVSSRSGAMAG